MDNGDDNNCREEAVARAESQEEEVVAESREGHHLEMWVVVGDRDVHMGCMKDIVGKAGNDAALRNVRLQMDVEATIQSLDVAAVGQEPGSLMAVPALLDCLPELNDRSNLRPVPYLNVFYFIFLYKKVLKSSCKNCGDVSRVELSCRF